MDSLRQYVPGHPIMKTIYETGYQQSRQGIFAVLNSVEIHRNRIYLGGQSFTGPGM